MSITLRDHKMLWGRAGARCSICRTSLTSVNELGQGSVIGIEAHIVARSPDGPRGNSPLETNERNSYSNLILLCPTHHDTIDDLPRGPIEYPVDLLHMLKHDHEQWVISLDSFNRAQQLAEEQWAAIIDNLDERMDWDSWTDNISPIFSADQLLKTEVYERLEGAQHWILARVWPNGNNYLRDTIETMGNVIEDLLLTFGEHKEEMPGYEGTLWTEKFYKIKYWSEGDYSRLLAEYEYHTALVEDLTFELTRYGNLIADIVRAEIDAGYRFEQGALLIRYGIDPIWRATTYRPVFAAANIEGRRQPYTTLQEFLSTRTSRPRSESNTGSPRTAAGRQDL